LIISYIEKDENIFNQKLLANYKIIKSEDIYMKRALALLLTGVFSLSVLLTGCGNSDNGTNQTDASNTGSVADSAGETKAGDAGSEQTTVVFAYWGAESENNAIKNVIADFEANNPAIKIEAQWIQSDYLTKVQVQIAGDTAADVYLMSASDLPGFADNYIAQEADTANYLSENLIESLTIDGELKSKPFIVKPKVMAINKTLFEEKNIDIPSLTESMTVQEFEDLAVQFVKEESSPQIFGSEPLWLTNWIYAFNGSYYTSDGMASNLTSSETIAAANFAIRSKELGYVPNDTQKEGQSMMDWFLSGRIAMYTDFGPWNIPQMEEVEGFEWELLIFPGNGGAKEVNGLSITKTSRNKEAAQIFVDYLCESERAQSIIGGDKSAYGVPVNPNVVRDFESIYEGKNLAAFVNAAYNQTPSETQKRTNEINSIHDRISDETLVGSGELTPEEVFPSIAEAVTSIIQR